VVRSFALIAALLLPCVLCGCFDEPPTRAPRPLTVDPPTQITLVAPNGGEVWTEGADCPIRWTSEGDCGSAVRIELLRDGELCLTIASSTPNDGFHPWSCGIWPSVEGAYRVRITDLASGRTDDSDDSFDLSPGDAPSCRLKLVAPSEDQTYHEGDRLDVIWQADGLACGPAVCIDLLGDSGDPRSIVEATPNDGVFGWPVALSEPVLSGRIRVFDPASGAEAVSRAVVTLIGPFSAGALQVIAPNGGEQWSEGELRAIEWRTWAPRGDAVTIELVGTDGTSRTIAADAPNSGTYLWRVEGSGQRWVRVTDLATSAADESDDPFTITSDPWVTLLSPNGGEAWIEGAVEVITWESGSNGEGTVDLELVRAGTVCQTIALSVPNQGSFEHIASRCAGQSEGYRVRIRLGEEAAEDESDGGFSILGPCEMKMTSPNGGEAWIAGKPYLLSWAPTGACGGRVDIELLIQDEPCLLLGEAVANSGSFLWTAEKCGYVESGYRVRVTDPSTGISTQSEGVFSIREACALHMIAPADGETWIEGVASRIEWFTSGECGGQVRIDLLQAGEVCQVIADRTENDGSFHWTPRRCGGYRSGYQVRVTDLDTDTPSTPSGSFTIEQPCALRILSPIGGESWPEESEQEIRWSRIGLCCERVRIDLLHDGRICRVIEPETENDGFHRWTPSRCGLPASGYRIRITDLETGKEAESHGPFSIPEPCRIELQRPGGGEAWVTGTTESIQWDPSNSCGEQVRIELVVGGTVRQVLAGDVPNSGRFSWAPEQWKGVRDGYRIRVTDGESGALAESGEDFSILASVFVKVAFSAAGAVAATNHDPWNGQVQLVVAGSGSHAFTTPDWSDCGGACLVLDPEEDREIFFYPALGGPAGAGNGLPIGSDCSGVEIRITGQSETESPNLRLTLDIGYGACSTEIPISTDCRALGGRFRPECFRGAGPIQIAVSFLDDDIWNRRYAVHDIEYIFHGWAADGP